jgi:hypothetical protein
MPQPPSIFDAGPQTLPVPSYLSNYIQPTFAHGLRIRWAFFWPTTLISAILGAAIDFGLRVIYEHTNIPADVIGPLMRFAPYVISYVVALFIMEYILRKNFRHFRIGLVSSGVSANAQALPATFARTVRVWWTYSWRTVLYRIITNARTTACAGGILVKIPRSTLSGIVATKVMMNRHRCRGGTFRDLFEYPRRGLWRFQSLFAASSERGRFRIAGSHRRSELARRDLETAAFLLCYSCNAA